MEYCRKIRVGTNEVDVVSVAERSDNHAYSEGLRRSPEEYSHLKHPLLYNCIYNETFANESLCYYVFYNGIVRCIINYECMGR
jgi:hypothetical protein